MHTVHGMLALLPHQGARVIAQGLVELPIARQISGMRWMRAEAGATGGENGHGQGHEYDGIAHEVGIVPTSPEFRGAA